MKAIRELLELAKSQLVEPGNIDLDHRPVVINDDDSYSTVESFSFGDENGNEILIPMVAPDGSMFPSQDAAIDYYYRTGQNLGKFTNPDAADSYAEVLHNSQEKQYKAIADALRATRGKQP